MPGLKGKYDAWNRLVEVRDSSDNLIARYDYNGRNQRIMKTVGSSVTKSFFNDQWQELESLTVSELTSYVCGLRYIDDLVLREKDAERLYSLADPNWNVVAIVDATGSVQERMKYDAFGKITWLDDFFVAKSNSDFAWNRTFTGQVLDVETAFIHSRKRYYYVELGRFISRDPIGYDANDVNIYRLLGNRPINYTDPFGTQYAMQMDPFIDSDFINQRGWPGKPVKIKLRFSTFFIRISVAKISLKMKFALSFLSKSSTTNTRHFPFLTRTLPNFFSTASGVSSLSRVKKASR